MRQWDLLVCPTCGEAVTSDEMAGDNEIWCSGADQPNAEHTKHRMKKMEVVRVQEVG